MIDFDLDRHAIHHVHFIGIGGISMSAIAEILLDLGYKVSGSDMKASNTTQRLSDKGAYIHIGHHKANISSCDLIVYTAAVKEDNPEFIAAKELKIPTLSRAEILGLIMKKFNTSIAVAGTHGKTTTTSMLSIILQYNHFDPTILVGGQLDAIGGNVRIGSRDYFLTEACEYVGSFLKFFPKIGIILNIEEDHLDYFKDIDHINQTFTEFANLIPSDGFLFAYNDDMNIKKILPNISCPIITYGEQDHNDYNATNIKYDKNGFPSFDVFFKKNLLGNIQLQVPGKHNVSNALAAVACAHSLGIDIGNISKSLYSFKGTHRRFDVLGVVNDIKIIDDYAHHPTEIKATLQAISNVPHNKLWCIFQPHTYTRTKSLLNDFASSFDGIDHLIITDIYAAREKDTGEIHSKDLVREIENNNQNVKYIKDFEDIVDYILKHAQPNDLVLTMGAGDINNVAKMLLEKLKG